MSLYKFDMSKDWTDEKNKAIARGDRAAAEQAERNHNQKIDILGLKNIPKTYDYIDIGTDIVNGIKTGADPNYIWGMSKERLGKAKNNPEYSQYAYDDIQDMAARYYYNGLAGEKPTYQSKYGNKIDEMLDKVLNGGSFSYDVNSDPVYQAYKDQYTREGNRAMQDTLAGLSMDAGGENSWAVSAAAQANNRYMQELSDKVPELYALAYDKYMTERNADMDRLSMLQNMENADYGRYIDAMNIYQTDRNFYDNQYNNWKNDARQDKQLADEKAQADLATFVQAGVRPPQGVLLRAGVTDPSAINALVEQVQNENAYNNTVRGYELEGLENNKILEDLAVQKALGQYGGNPYTGPDGGNPYTGPDGGNPYTGPEGPEDEKGGGYDNGSLSTAQVKQLQKELGVTADGLWGSNSRGAAGGLSADDAWEKYFGDDGGNGIGAGISSSSVNNLGLGPISDEKLLNLVESGAVILNADGTVQWANGYSPSNYKYFSNFN